MSKEATGDVKGVISSALLLAAVVVTWMLFWMRRQSINLRGELQAAVDRVLSEGTAWGLAALAFTALAFAAAPAPFDALSVDLSRARGAGFGGAAARSTRRSRTSAPSPRRSRRGRSGRSR